MMFHHAAYTSCRHAKLRYYGCFQPFSPRLFAPQVHPV